MRKYTDYEILDVYESSGQVQVRWSVPGDRRKAVIRVHDIPLEAELGDWDEEQLVELWRKDVPDVPDIPDWLKRYVDVDGVY